MRTQRHSCLKETQTMKKIMLRGSAAAGLTLLLLMITACATSQIQRARQVDVDVHAVVTGLDDAERALCNLGSDQECHSTLPKYTTALHRQVNQHMLTLLRAGNALNEGVAGTITVNTTNKANLETVSAEIVLIKNLLKPVLPAGHNVLVWTDAVTDAVLKLLPLFLK